MDIEISTLIRKGIQPAPKHHDLTEIACELKSLHTPLAKPTSEYTESRYPDAATGVPGHLSTWTMADEIPSQETWKWVERQL